MQNVYVARAHTDGVRVQTLTRIYSSFRRLPAYIASTSSSTRILIPPTTPYLPSLSAYRPHHVIERVVRDHRLRSVREATGDKGPQRVPPYRRRRGHPPEYLLRALVTRWASCSREDTPQDAASSFSGSVSLARGFRTQERFTSRPFVARDEPRTQPPPHAPARRMYLTRARIGIATPYDFLFAWHVCHGDVRRSIHVYQHPRRRPRSSRPPSRPGTSPSSMNATT